MAVQTGRGFVSADDPPEAVGILLAALIFGVGRRRRSGWMREDPGLDLGEISAGLEAHYGLRVASVAFLPVGHDPNAAAYKIISREGEAYFLKVRFGPVDGTGLLVPRALIELGVPNILAPLRTRSSGLWFPLDDHGGHGILYPFVRGESAMVGGLSDEQWREFGRTLRAVHDSGLGGRRGVRLPVETFALPSAALVRRLVAVVEETAFEGVAARLASFWRERAGQIQDMIVRAEELGRSLRTRSFEHVPCHADVHAANILVGEDGRIHLVDWNGPLIAPRERDLLFVIGSKIAREVQPREESLFFEGYGPVEIHPDALIYYRYERIIEDIGEFGKSVFLNRNLSESARTDEAELFKSLFAPKGIIETVALRALKHAPP
jgi:spectinomycin phosphotransferase